MGEPRLRHQATRAFTWVAAVKGLERALGAVRIVVFARLLAPDDFGAFGVAALAIATLDRFTRPGLSVALVQRKGDVEPYLHPTWTLLLIRSWALAGLLYLSRHAVADFFATPAAVPLMSVVAAATAVGGFTSLSLVLLQRDLRLQGRFQAMAVSGLADFAVALPAAIVLRDPMALALGLLGRNLALVVASYLVHPYRPRPTLDWRPLRDLRDFAVHGVYQSWLFFVVEQGDDAFVGKALGQGALGLYQVGYRVANILTQEVARMISEVTLPIFSRVQDDPKHLRIGVVELLGASMGVILPAVVFLAVAADDFIAVALGAQWTDVTATFRILLVFGLARSLSLAASAALVARGEMGFMTRTLVVQLLVVAALVFPLGLGLGLPGVALAVTASQLASFAMTLFRTRRVLDTSALSLLLASRGPMAGSAVAGLATWLVLLALAQTPLSAATRLLAAAVAMVVLYAGVGLPLLRRDAPTLANALEAWTSAALRRRGARP